MSKSKKQTKSSKRQNDLEKHKAQLKLQLKGLGEKIYSDLKRKEIETFNSEIPTVLADIVALPTVPPRSPPIEVPDTLVESAAHSGAVAPEFTVNTCPAVPFANRV